MSAARQAPATNVMASCDTVADLIELFDGIPPSRIRWVPTPGTATDVDAIGAEQRFGRLCELVDGTLVEKAGGLYESILAGIIAGMIGEFVRPRRVGAVAGEGGMMRVVHGRVRMPDVSFTSWARVPADYRSNPAPRVSPDLAVEVLSPTNTVAEMARKRAEYFAGGTRLVWIVDPPTRTAAVFMPAHAVEPAVVHGPTGTVDGGDVLPGFTMFVADLFAAAERPPVA